jgi:hypothetical protein
MDGRVSTHPCNEWRGDVAMLALGRLDAADTVRTQAHVDGCESCRRALAELQPTASMLALVDPETVLSVAVPPPDLADRIVRQVRDEQRARRRRRRRHVVTATLAAAAMFLVVLGTAVVIATRNGGSSPREFAVESPGVDASFSLEPNREGTAVRLEHQGLDPEAVYWLWLTDASGERVSAGTFHGSTDRSSLVLQSAMPIDQAVRIWVTDEDDGVVLDSQL